MFGRGILHVSLVAVAGIFGGPILTDTSAHAGRAVAYTEWNNSPAPNAYYGGCSAGPADGNKFGILSAAHLTQLNGLLAVSVLQCDSFGGGPYGLVPCPAGSPFQQCVNWPNDGVGNHVLLGVLRPGASTDPNANYTGCPAGHQTRPKIDLLEEAGRDPRVINGIVTISCQAFDGAGGSKVVACPTNPTLYIYCIENHNDGQANHVLLGVVGANGNGDPFALYGECGSAGQGIAAGFRPKSALLLDIGIGPAGRARVSSMEFLGCKIRQGEPATLTKTYCAEQGSGSFLMKRFDYCIWGTDSRGNALDVGVILDKMK